MKNLIKNKALILVPHEDDEINTAGNMILQLLLHNFEIFVCFATNGDYENSAETRYREAINALKMLGIDKKHVQFLGYGDTFWDYNGGHLYHSINKPVESNAGHIETYGTEKINEWSYNKYGIHRSYLKDNYINDITDVILSIKPDVIICNDYDQHPDHRMLSLCFDKALYSILSIEKGAYQPIVLKKFAYPMAFSAVDDITNINLLETQRPTVSSTRNYLDDLMDKSCWEWDKRIRFPVCKDAMKNTLLIRNRIVRAILKHRSQNIATHIGSIINCDDIFWQRRTDNLAFCATVSGTSGDYNKVADFSLIDTDNIMEMHSVFANYLWQPSDEKKEILFTWDTPQKIRKIVIYGNIENIGRIKNLSITINGNFEKKIGPMPDGGLPLYVEFENLINVTTCKLKVLETEGVNWGIAECEFFESEMQKGCLWPIAKILVNNCYSDRYYVSCSTQKCEIGFYSNWYEGDVILETDANNESLANGRILEISKKHTTITARSESGELLDKVIIIKPSEGRLKFKYVLMSLDRSFIKIIAFKYRLLRWMGYYRKEGIKYVVMRLYCKIKKG